MKFLVIVVTLVVACCYAAPTSDLQHPSPINPSVIVELKPQEKETKPYVHTSLPDDVPHHITKRDHKQGHDNKQKAPEPPKRSSHHSPAEIAKKPVQKSHHEAPKSSPSNKRNRRHTETYQLPQTLPAVLIEMTEPTKNVFQKPQILPEILTENAETVQQHKRDIPVPLVPKHQHPEESPKESNEEKQDEKEKHEKNSKTISNENHPNKDEVQVEDLSEPKPLHQTLNLKHSIPAVVPSTIKEDKHITLKDSLSAPQSVSSTTEHPVVRPKPVPVAELFARSHDN